MRVIKGTVNEEMSVHPLTEGNTAPSLPTVGSSSHNVQLAHQVKSQLSLLEDMHHRMQFMLREVNGIVKKV